MSCQPTPVEIDPSRKPIDARARKRFGFQRRQGPVVCCIAQPGSNQLAARGVTKVDRWDAIVGPAIAQLHQRDESREELDALGGESILVTKTATGLAMGHTAEDALVDEGRRPCTEHALDDGAGRTRIQGDAAGSSPVL